MGVGSGTGSILFAGAPGSTVLGLTVVVLHSVAVVLYAESWGFSAAQWLAAINPAQQAPDRLTYKVSVDGHALVWRTNLLIAGQRRDVVIKSRPLADWRARCQSLLHNTQHHRQWRGARLLQARGLRAAQPLALLRARTDDGMQELLVLAPIEGRTLLHMMSDKALPLEREHATARQIGTLLASLEQARLWNRDCKPSNLMIHPESSGVTVLDTVAIRPWRPAAMARMLADLAREPLARGCLPRRALLMRAIAAAVGSGRAQRSRRHELWRAAERRARDAIGASARDTLIVGP